MQAADPKAKSKPGDRSLFAAHDGVSFIIVMTLGIGFLAVSMLWKVPLF